MIISKINYLHPTNYTFMNASNTKNRFPEPVQNKTLYTSSNITKESFLVALKNNSRGNYLPAFCRKIDEYDKQQCKTVINKTAAACALTAGAVGKASAFGIDPWVQRGLQTTMFLYLADYLNVEPAAATYYAGIEFFSGARLGIEAGKMLTGIGGIIADTITGGASVPATEGITRSTNAALSMYLTRRMGNNFLKHVENGSMTSEKQFLRSTQYTLRRLALGGLDSDVSITDIDDFDIDKFSDILKDIPDSEKSLIGKIYANFFQDGISRAPSVFLANFVPPLIVSMVNNKTIDKNTMHKIIENTAITSIIYEMCNIAVDGELTLYAQNKYDELNKNLENYPELYKEFNNIFKNVSHKTRLDDFDKIETKEFLNQFKNKEFVFELSRSFEMEVKSFINKYREIKKQEFEKNKKELLEKTSGFNEKINNEIKKENTPEMQAANAAIAKILAELATKQKCKDFGLNIIAGYAEQKLKLDAVLGNLLKTDNVQSYELPNTILIYGPRGVGKTTISKAASDDYGCRCIKKTFVGNKKSIYEKIKNIAQEARELYETSDIPRHTILIMDECTSFLSNGQNYEDKTIINEFKKFLHECARKYHLTIIMTTNYPEKIDSSILDNNTISLTLPMHQSTKNDIIQILKYYSAAQENINYDYIADKILEKAGNDAYSNTQIKAIGCCKPLKGKLTETTTTGKMLEILNNLEPEIKNADIQRIHNFIEQEK